MVIQTRGLNKASSATEGKSTSIATILTGLGWFVVTLLLSTPSVIYCMSASLPPDNIFGLSQLVFDIVHHCSGALIYLLSAYVVPFLSRRACRWIKKDHLSAQLITLTRTFMILLAPFCAVVIMNQDCSALWLTFWRPCQKTKNFRIVYAPGVLHPVPTKPEVRTLMEGFEGLDMASFKCYACPTMTSLLEDALRSNVNEDNNPFLWETLGTTLTHHSDICR